uniref:Uncharacterized protein n=1 Tax=Tanacetum cinerariifolium TaxID=118510 RepID=A0A699GNU8_TANCI|nr:hypothetical protein [Tanacetum cinerariifolium]
MLGIKCTRHSHCQLWCSHWQKKFPLQLKKVPTAIEESSHCQKKRDATAEKIALLLKSSSNCQSKPYDSYAKLVPHVSPCILGVTVIEFGDSYEAPANVATNGSADDGSGKKKGRIVTLTTDENVADLLTKPFDAGRLQYLVSEHNVDFLPIVDFVEASPLRIETMEKGTKILATVDGIIRTITESSLRRNLWLKD